MKRGQNYFGLEKGLKRGQNYFGLKRGQNYFGKMDKLK